MAPNDTAPAICTDTDRTFVFMPLSNKGEPEVEADRMSLVTSASQPAVALAAKSSPPKAAATAPAPKGAVAVPAPVKRRRNVTAKRDTVKPSSKVALLQVAEQLRNDMRKSRNDMQSAIVRINSLIREVKSMRQKDRLLETTMDNLRKLSLA
jgi:hypothetical protein